MLSSSNVFSMPLTTSLIFLHAQYDWNLIKVRLKANACAYAFKKSENYFLFYLEYILYIYNKCKQCLSSQDLKTN